MHQGQFLEHLQKLWPFSVADIEDIGLDMLDSVHIQYPYRKAHLHTRKIGKKLSYYIEYWAYNVDTKKLQRLRRTFNLNKLTAKARKKRAREMISLINELLQNNGYISNSCPNVQDKNKLADKTIIEAMEHAYSIKVNINGISEKTADYYHNHLKVFTEWLTNNDFVKTNIGGLNEKMIRSFMDHLKTERELKNRTYNHYLSSIRSFINEINKRERDIFKVDPSSNIEKLPTKAYKHAAYSNTQMQQIKRYFHDKPDKQYVLRYIQWIYYTLARPNEVRNLKIGDIDLDTDRILFQAGNSKSDENFTGIPPAIREIIKEDKLLNLPPDYYIFGIGGKPGVVPMGKNHFYKQNKQILKDLRLREINPHYSIYSYKHSGAISLYTATKDIKLLQYQMRHKQVSQTEDYLRDLGILVGYEGLKKWEGAI